MTGLEGIGVAILSGAALHRLAGWAREWVEEYKLVRACPHPPHRIYQMFGDEGPGEYLCDECGCVLTYEEEEEA